MHGLSMSKIETVKDKVQFGNWGILYFQIYVKFHGEFLEALILISEDIFLAPRNV